MNIYYIALPSEHDRRANIEGWLSNTPFKFNWVPAKTGADDIDCAYSERDRLRRFGFPMSEPEIGCFLSHRECWRRVVESNEISLILESDAVPADLSNLVESLTIIETPELVSRYDLVRLAGVFPKNEKFPRTIAHVGHSNLLQFLGDPMGSAAYVVTPVGARKLLQCSQRFFVPVDVYLGCTWLHRLRVRSLRPYPIETAYFDSVIGDRRRPRQTWVERLKIELARAWDDIRRVLYIPVDYFR